MIGICTPGASSCLSVAFIVILNNKPPGVYEPDESQEADMCLDALCFDRLSAGVAVNAEISLTSPGSLNRSTILTILARNLNDYGY